MVIFSDAPSVNNIRPSGLSDLANGVDVKKLTEQLSNQKILVTTLIKVNNFLEDRFRRLERTVESYQLAVDNLSTALIKQEAESDVLRVTSGFLPTERDRLYDLR